MKLRWSEESGDRLALDAGLHLLGVLHLSIGGSAARFNFFPAGRFYRVRSRTRDGAKREALRIAVRWYKREAARLLRMAEVVGR
jgi:hypothetical protein